MQRHQAIRSQLHGAYAFHPGDSAEDAGAIVHRMVRTCIFLFATALRDKYVDQATQHFCREHTPVLQKGQAPPILTSLKVAASEKHNVSRICHTKVY